jgi:hypothetical protein
MFCVSEVKKIHHVLQRGDLRLLRVAKSIGHFDTEELHLLTTGQLFKASKFRSPFRLMEACICALATVSLGECARKTT